MLPPSSEFALPETQDAVPTNRLSHLLNHLQPNPETVVLLLSLLIGVGAGTGVVTFHFLIELIHRGTFETLMGEIAHWGPWTLACGPILGGILVSIMRWRWQDFGPGISSLIRATQENAPSSSLPLKPVAKMVAAAISLGTGASLGPEGPSVEIGANFGVLLGRILQVSQERQRLLLGAGAAAGLAAGFNAPIAGVFFALEVVLGTTFATSAVSVVLLAAVVAALIAQIGLGSQPAFTLPAYDVRSPFELPLYMGLGLFASLISVTYTQSIKFAQDAFQGKILGFPWLNYLPRWIHPVLGGICIGLVGLYWPQILGVGYETVEAMLRDVEFSLPLLVTLLIVKMLMTAVSLGSGLVGGVFAPAMFLGASLGAAYGKVMALLLPASLISIAAPPAYAMVGMAAVLAGSARAPLTAILLMFELTRDYRIVLPLMAAAGLSIWLVERLKPTRSRAANLERIGLSVEIDSDLEALQQLSVKDAMENFVLTLPETLSVLEAGQQLINQHLRSALVMNQANQVIGIVTLQDINRAASRLDTEKSYHYLSEQTIGEICTTDLIYAHPDEPLPEALRRMAARGLRQLPVVNLEQSHQVVGVLEREGISLACTLAITHRLLKPQLSVISEPEVPKADHSEITELKQPA
ncbi:MAG: chloride channel protein [Leptolyngbyaceae cyanobacterium bins.59]|nr:chloride channel protein [Leptolyngbyaceae cyanobacterium bins.59]